MRVTFFSLSSIDMQDLQFSSFNVNGLNGQTKRRSVFSLLRKVASDINLIQESHSSDTVASIWRNEWGGMAFFNHSLSNSRGVAILFARDFKPQVVKQFRDDFGRILLLDIKVDGEVLTLGSVYAPTQDKPHDQAEFMSSLEAALETMAWVNILIAGDLNCILDPVLDKSTSVQAPVSTDEHRSRLRSFMEENSLTDGGGIVFQPNPTLPLEEDPMPLGWIYS